VKVIGQSLERVVQGLGTCVEGTGRGVYLTLSWLGQDEALGSRMSLFLTPHHPTLLGDGRGLAFGSLCVILTSNPIPNQHPLLRYFAQYTKTRQA